MDAIPRNARVATYRRNSSDQQVNSIEDQAKSIDLVVREYGLDVVREYVDQGVSGSTIHGRDSLLALLDEARSLKIQFLLSYDISRLSRGGQGDFWEIVKKLKHAGVIIYSCQHRMFVTEENGAIFGIEASFARSHNVKHSRDITRTLIESVRTRKSDPGRMPPYGFDRMRYDESGQAVERVRYLPDGAKVTMDPETGEVRMRLNRSEALPKVKSHRVELVPGSPEAVETLKRIFSMARTMGFVSIADVLNREGIPGPRGGLWSGSSIRDIVKNVAYKGTLRYGRTYKAKYHRVCQDQPLEFGFLREGQLNQGDVPEAEWYVESEWNEALIPPAEFDEVQEALAVRSSRATRTLRSGRHTYVLSGIARCARCGSPLQGLTQKNKNGRVYCRYTCATARKHGSGRCASYSLDAHGLETFVLREVHEYLDTDCVLESLRQGLEQLLDERSDGMAHLEMIRRKMKETAAKMSALFKVFTPENIGAFRVQIDELTAEKKCWEKAMAKAEREAGIRKDKEAVIAQALDYYQEHVLALRGGCENALRESLLALGVSVTYDPDNEEGGIEVHPFGHSAAS